MYANIIIDITHEKLDKIFQYRIPQELEGLIEAGQKVEVPFGKGNTKKEGYVVGFAKEPDYDVDKIKDILAISKDSLAIETKLVALAAWMKETYGGTMIQSLKTVLPIKRKENEQQKRKIVRLIDTNESKKKLEYFLKKNQKARARVMEALIEREEIDYSEALHTLKVTASVLNPMEEQGILAIESERVFRNPKIEKSQDKKIQFNEEQQCVIESVKANYDMGDRKTCLIHGVTGSGKTEVYMEIIEHVVNEGKQAIVLIPEISLTYQTVMRFYRKFKDRVSVLNSRMSAGERFDQMQRAKEGKIDVMIGPRSALFTPFENLGIIVIDEEHEPSYKSEQMPRYHARETAEERARIEGAMVILGSATPSLESYHRCKMGEYRLFTLKHRVDERELSTVDVVDMREELKKGNRSIFSDLLLEKMQDKLEKGQQIMLFINRRGYAGFVSCRSCGEVIKCPHCDVSLSVHNNGKMVCHYCGYETPQVDRCPTCGSKFIGRFRTGTQKIEDLVKKTFPTARVLRMDLDTTRGKGAYEEILSSFVKGEADILVGTQMIVKGHDFPNVTLVGVLAADISLYSDDYRSSERTFQILTQAAGRAGRGKEKGEVIIQTYKPDNYSIQRSADQDYEGFYKEEMEYRSLAGYPPARNLLAVLMVGKDEELLDKAAGYLKTCAQRVVKGTKISVIGPAEPYVGKVNDSYRKILYLKSTEYGMLVKVKNYLEQYIEINSGFSSLKIQFDFNPVNIF